MVCSTFVMSCNPKCICSLTYGLPRSWHIMRLHVHIAIGMSSYSMQPRAMYFRDFPVMRVDSIYALAVRSTLNFVRLNLQCFIDQYIAFPRAPTIMAFCWLISTPKEYLTSVFQLSDFSVSYRIIVLGCFLFIWLECSPMRCLKMRFSSPIWSFRYNLWKLYLYIARFSLFMYRILCIVGWKHIYYALRFIRFSSI